MPETTVPETPVLHNELKIRGAILGDEVPASDATVEDTCWAESWICRTRYTNYQWVRSGNK